MLKTFRVQSVYNCFRRRQFARKVVPGKSAFSKTTEEVVNSPWFHRVVKYGPVAVKYIPLVIVHGPKVVLSLAACTGIGYGIYAIRTYSTKLSDFKRTVSEKCDGVAIRCADYCTAVGEKIQSVRGSIGGAVDDLKKRGEDSSDAVVDKCNGISATAGEGYQAARNRIGEVTQKVKETKDAAANEVIAAKGKVLEKWDSIKAPSSAGSSPQAGTIANKAASIKDVLKAKLGLGKVAEATKPDSDSKDSAK